MSNQYPAQFQRFMIGQDQQQEAGNRTNKYLGKEAEWSKHGFSSQSEVQAAFQDSRYETDPEFRDAVIIMLGNSPEEHAPGMPGSGIQVGQGVLEKAMANRAAARAAEDQAIYNEKITEMFNNPKYQTSPSYRREVEDFIRAHEAEIQNAVGHRAIDRTHDALPIRIQMDGDALNETRQKLKADNKANAKAQANEAARSAARRAYFQALGQDDPGEHGEHGVSDESIFNDDAPVTA
ncbi:MAG: hypothetical protein JSR20_14755 [Nitrospira sp.]|nr:hypothetical protein [Nitrospira sp.]